MTNLTDSNNSSNLEKKFLDLNDSKKFLDLNDSFEEIHTNSQLSEIEEKNKVNALSWILRKKQKLYFFCS